jgi:hypothetical protein
MSAAQESRTKLLKYCPIKPIDKTIQKDYTNLTETKRSKQGVTTMATKVTYTTDKNGKPCAYYYGAAHRWIKISLDKAALWIATEQAILVNEEPKSMKRFY